MQEAKLRALDNDSQLLTFLLENPALKARFFTQINDALIFEKSKFLEFLKLLKEHFPQCFDKNGKLMPLKLQEAILDLANAQDSLDSKDSRDKDSQDSSDSQRDKDSLDLLDSLDSKDSRTTDSQDSQDNGAFSLSKESYSLNWLGKSYAKLMRHLPPNTLIAQDTEHNSQATNANSQNVLIKGDNLEVLKHLKNAYYRKIKCIYIDPPYNTGGDGFIYNDERTFTPQSLAQLAHIEIDEAKKILDYTLKSSSTHSAWLSFMYPRLYIARQLLRDDGVIFISIDDNECANLKILCDEIFGEENFVTSVPRLTSSQRSGQEDYMNISHDYILIYSYATDFNNSTARKNLDKNKIKQDKNGYFIKGDTKAILASQTQGYSKGGDYDFEYNGKIYKPIDSKGKRNRWLWNLKRMQAAADLGILVETKTSLRMQIYLDKKFDEKTNTMIDKDENLIFHTADLMTDNKFTNATGTKELEKILNAKVFDNPKPTNLIKTLLQLATTADSNDIILDFFAGSGTTAHAVMELNAQDNGNRQFILVQLDEKIDSKKSKSKVAYDFCKNELGSENPSIFDITKERIKRASKKIGESRSCHTERSEVSQKTTNRDISVSTKPQYDNVDCHDSLRESRNDNKADCHEKSSDFSRNDSIISEIDLGFKVYELREGNIDSTNGSLIDLSDSDKNALLETFRLQDSLPLSVANKLVNLDTYSAILAGQNLYLLDSGFDSNALKDLIARIDSDKDFVIKEISYLNNAFDSAKIRELVEGIQSYANKKGLKILVRGRFI